MLLKHLSVRQVGVDNGLILYLNGWFLFLRFVILYIFVTTGCYVCEQRVCNEIYSEILQHICWESFNYYNYYYTT